MTQILEKISDTRKDWFQKGNEIWSELQTKSNGWLVDLNTRRDRLIERSQEALVVGQKALSGFERSTLQKAADFLSWAYTITGERSDLASDMGEILERIHRHTDKPVAVGFGISTPEQARHVAGIAEGVVVGSAIVRLIAEHGVAPAGPEEVRAFARSLVEASKES